MKTVVAIDLGASNGRVIQIDYQNQKIQLTNVHRFLNESIYIDGNEYWDIEYLFSEIIQGIKKVPREITSIGIDSWGVDIAIIGQDGQLLGNPYCYRDPHTLSVMEEVHKTFNPYELYKRTGVIPNSINTLYQLKAIFKQHPEYKKEARAILTLPSVINYLLTGEIANEFTHSSTTQMLSRQTKEWDYDLLTQVFNEEIPLAPIKESLSVYGETKVEFPFSQTKVIQTPGHDTACALAALPRSEKMGAFMSCGTWIIIGLEVPEPVVTKEAYDYGLTNEGTVNGSYRLQKNNMGLWLVQQCRKQWKEEGKHISYQEESQLLSEAQAFRSLIDPDDMRFFNPDSMIKEIQAYCVETNQAVPRTEGQILRCIIESLSLKYRWVIEKLEEVTGQSVPSIHMGGGGILNEALCQFTSNATQRKTEAGPVEASSIGNGLSQLIALGEVKNWAEAERIVAQSFEIKKYEPKDQKEWNQAYEKFLTLL